ncbi:ATP-grasp domain-containing protein [Roseateles sp. DAIF2]|uniref:ATP-grasp domain-containing protein n=1 Tax=Roseateles sp. DAIF2 TaxID=2714952 RepID=UPI0018A2795A|nr:ATP-grasp domain-containing protein [Roseateles sp. DAIF2]QPF74102.1 ATP-grasp domain-containing protein [Roseateles sp. DAIF2]
MTAVGYKPLETVLIVDGFSTAAYLAPALRSYGLRCVHLLSSPNLPRQHVEQLQRADYQQCLVHEGDFDATLAALRPLGIGLILHGFDSALELVDRLGEALDLPWRNPLASSAARRDKELMTEAVRRAGLRAPEQLLARTVEEALDWARPRLPVVLKPTRSAGVRGVRICRSEEEVREAAAAVLDGLSFYEDRNEGVLVQRCSQGQEYIVDSVSFEGRHRLVSLWQVERDRRAAPRLEHMLVVDHRESRYRALIDYAFAVLDALELRYGASHLEIMDTPEGPSLIELNARMHGSLDPRLTTAVSGENHVSATVETFLNPAGFERRLQEAPEFRGHCGHLLLVAPRGGRLARDFIWSEIAALPSFVSTKQWVKPGDLLQPTTDLKTALGMVGLFHPRLETLEQDTQRIRALEQQFFADTRALEPA